MALTLSMTTRSFPWWPIARTVLLAASVGAAAGIIATVLTTQALERYADYLLDRYRAPSVSTEKPSPLPGTYEEALSRVRTSADASVVLFVPSSSDTSSPSSMLDETSTVAYGVVISSDGWVATTKLAPSNLPSTDAWIDGTRYSVSRVVDDSLSELRLVKLEAQDLTSVGFGSSNLMESGEMLFALSSDAAVIPTSLEASDMQVLAGAQAAETFTTMWKLGDALSSSVPLVNASGDLVGFTLEDGTAMPLHHALGFLQRSLRDSEVGHAGLGAYIVDLSRVLNVDPILRQGATSGALVLSSSTADRALLRGGAGAEAGLAVRDIILSVDGEAVTPQTTLAELLATYEAGQTARLSVLRGGETTSVTVTFGDADDLVY